MNLSWLCWYKHFHLVCLLVSLFFLGTFASGGTPTEEDTKANVASVTPSLSNDLESISSAIEDALSVTELVSALSGAYKKLNGNSDESSNDRHGARAFPSTGWNWKTTGRMVSKGLRMFRESLLEGAKVAHMFKEDFDEGMSSIMRQNRGVKADPGKKPNDSGSNSGSFFDSQMLREGVLGGLLRFMGINSKQMGVIALNVLIILAEWITSAMIGGNEVGVTSRMIKSNLLQWANTGHNSQIEKIITQVKSHNLPEKLIDKLSQRTGNTTSCVQLLICKMSPVIWGLQDTVKDQMKNIGIHEETGWKTSSTTSSPPVANGTNSNFKSGSFYDEPRGILATSQFLVDNFIEHLPPTERMVDFGDRCESKFPNCQLLKFSSVK